MSTIIIDAVSLYYYRIKIDVYYEKLIIFVKMKLQVYIPKDIHNKK